MAYKIDFLGNRCLHSIFYLYDTQYDVFREFKVSGQSGPYVYVQDQDKAQYEKFATDPVFIIEKQNAESHG